MWSGSLRSWCHGVPTGQIIAGPSTCSGRSAIKPRARQPPYDSPISRNGSSRSRVVSWLVVAHFLLSLMLLHCALGWIGLARPQPAPGW
jgi:hypothetical protein